MNLAQIKTEIGIPALELNTATDKDGNKTEWMRHWDNNRRIAVSLHKDLVAELSKNPATTGLGMQETQLVGEQGPYRAIRIVKYTPAEITL